eukprot:TRINITY_DN20522_c0_g1_i2.p1 TRINITY_DN20522_c0_g1~~TRINITY_DN20522_c0_g1_i2.p1  ORF type:complete len:407 (-),score=86.88 TRINITY_DN20522_c0_g1_i2:9-1079(-)
MTSPIVVSSANNSTEFEPVLVNLNPRKSPCKHGYIPLEFRPTVDAAAKVEADGTSFSLDDGKIMCLDYGKTVHKSVSVSSGSVLMDVNGLSKELARGDILSTDAVKLPCGRISVDFYRVSPLPHWFITSLGSVIAVDAGLRTSLDLYPNQQYQFKFSDLGNVTYTKESKVILTYWTVKGFEGRLEDFEFETTSTCELVSRYRYILTMRVLLAIAIFLSMQFTFFLFCLGGLWGFWKRFCAFFIIEGIHIPIYFGPVLLCTMHCGHCAIFRRNRRGELQDAIPMEYLPGGAQPVIEAQSVAINEESPSPAAGSPRQAPEQSSINSRGEDEEEPLSQPETDHQDQQALLLDVAAEEKF